MAVFIPAPNAGKIEMRYTQESQQIENVYHVVGAAPMTAADLSAVALIFKNWWNANVKTYVVPTASLNTIVATALDAATSPAIVYATGLPIVGTNGGAPAALHVTVAIRWLTALRGRSFTGRTYHIGISEGYYTGSKLDTGYSAALVIAYNALQTALGGSSYSQCITSYRHNKAPRTTAVSTDVTGCTVDETLDSQRRRLPGRGR